MNADQLYDTSIEVYAYIQAHYQYYSGVAIGMLLDNRIWSSWVAFLRHILIGIIIAHLTLLVLKANGTPYHIVLLVCSVTGIIGNTALRYFTAEALPEVMKALTDKILSKIKG